MLPILLDISGTINEFMLTKPEVDSLCRYVIARVSEEYMQQWEKEVGRELKQTKQLYLQSMSVEYPDDRTAVFMLSGKGESKLALMLEEGVSPFDEKTGFERSSKKKQKADGGWYLTIPFQLATAGSIAESSVFSDIMPKAIQNIAKSQSGEGIKEAQLPQQFQVKGVRKEMEMGGKMIPSYEHKAARYVGVIHSNNKNEEKYMKFRRVSDTSDEEAWIHPGFGARNLMEKALDTVQVDRVFDVAIDEFLTSKFS
jgi:hypothetical protein